MTNDLTPQTLQQAVRAALKHWGDLSGAPADLLENLRLTHQERQKTAVDAPATRRLAANQVLLQAIEALGRQDPAGARLLSLRFLDGESVLMAGRTLNLSQDQVKRRQRTAVTHLAEIIWQQESALRQQQIATLEAGLPPVNYDQLFGIDAPQAELARLLQTADIPWVIALVGIGGIGKTALADAAARQIIPHFRYERILWLRWTPPAASETAPEMLRRLLSDALAPGADFARLRQTLKNAPHLIILDNLEEAADLVALADVLTDLANPGKFLLTSRTRLPATALARSLTVPQLTETAVAALIAHQAAYLHLPTLLQPSAGWVAQIYAHTGGNPLAVKLVIGLATALPLEQILADLRQAQIGDVAQMYRHIYWRSWHALSDNGRALLKMMPLAAGSGVTPAQMAAMSRLSEAQLWPAISELSNRSLLEARGTALERRYLIHPLTNAFLRTDIIHWPDAHR